MTPTIRTAIAAAGLIAAVQAASAADAATLVALTADNALVSFDSETRRAGAPVRVTGTDGRLLG
ncbi:hypothetical protein ACLF3G_29470, partial [Falsiroseomonas sp. HC035]|uniref:hypothetical protein n=1 Tax=Falsiroseomonas sp. HC035 TaxID=3390999 RepID=UPI003D323EBD